MERLPRNYPLSKFNQCQICGRDGDITTFTMFMECDDSDVPEPGNIIIICRKGLCHKQLFDHERLYVEVPWGQGEPGYFMLLCGNCSHRSGTKCFHPNLKSNGGTGLMLKFSGLPEVRVHFTNGTCANLFPNPFTWCEGNPNRGR